MIDKQLEITVVGPVGAGKSALLFYIKEALEDIGVTFGELQEGINRETVRVLFNATDAHKRHEQLKQPTPTIESLYETIKRVIDERDRALFEVVALSDKLSEVRVLARSLADKVLP